MKKKTKKTIGILGGMGPDASASVYMACLRYAQHQYGAAQDADYPGIIINSLSLEGFDETGVVDAPLVEAQLVEAVSVLEAAGVDVIIIACNTVHIFYDAMQAAVSVPIIHIVKETVATLMQDGHSVVGLLASESTVHMNLYKDIAESSGVTVIHPTAKEQRVLNTVIAHVMGGHQGKADIIALKKIMQRMMQEGGSAIVLGCTEIPLAINATHTDMPLYNSTDVLVEQAVDMCM